MPKLLDHASICQRLAVLAEHIDWHLPMTAVYAAVGVSERTLRNVCHAQFGVSPALFLRQHRLARARAALLAAEPADTVAAIAIRFGFDQLGHFAGWYGATYGEKPSDTLVRFRTKLGRERRPALEGTEAGPVTLAELLAIPPDGGQPAS